MSEEHLTTNQLAQKFDGLERKVEGLTSEMHEFIGFVKENVAMKADFDRFATKDDLQNFATKDDLQNFATKDDLQNFATKDDFDRFATKEDLQDVRQEVLAVSDQVARLQLTIEQELVAPTLRMDRFEGRLQVVEAKLGLAS